MSNLLSNLLTTWKQEMLAHLKMIIFKPFFLLFPFKILTGGWGGYVCLPQTIYFQYFYWAFPFSRCIWNTFRLFYANISRFAGTLGRECKSMKYFPSLEAIQIFLWARYKFKFQSKHWRMNFKYRRRGEKEKNIFGIYTIHTKRRRQTLAKSKTNKFVGKNLWKSI